MNIAKPSLTLLCAALCCGTAAIVHASTITIIFDNPTGTLTPSQSYSSGGVTLTAYGFDSSGPSNLYGKANGGDENGIGLANDPHGDHEIVKGSFVQLDISELLAHGFNTAEIFVGIHKELMSHGTFLLLIHSAPWARLRLTAAPRTTRPVLISARFWASNTFPSAPIIVKGWATKTCY